MPNHIQNKLQIIGDNVEKVRAEISSKDRAIDFNEIIPMPDSLHVECHTGVINAVKNALQIGVHENELIGMLESKNRANQESPLNFSDEDWDDFMQCLQNKREHGFIYWYEWAVENWDTKWNAYQQSDRRNTLNTIWFQTAWAMPENIIKTLSEKYPYHKFKIEWASEDTGYNVGMKMFNNGNVIDERIPEGGTKEAYEFCFALWPDRENRYELKDGEYEYVEEL